jgi:hypothetical protein
VDEAQQTPPHGAHVHLRPGLLLRRLPRRRHGRWGSARGGATEGLHRRAAVQSVASVRVGRREPRCRSCQK